MSELTYLRGRLSFRRKATGETRGHEDWAMTRNRDGSRTMRCLAMTTDTRYVRDVTYTLGTSARPRELYMRLQVGSKWMGSGYFRNQGNRLMAVTDGLATGHAVQAVEVPEAFHVMTHSVMLDGWIFWGYDEEIGGEQTLTIYNTSTRWNGTDGPLGRVETLRAELLGMEEVEVPAGRFESRRFQVINDAIENPPAQIWISGEHNLLVRYDWNSLGLEYVLESLDLAGEG